MTRQFFWKPSHKHLFFRQSPLAGSVAITRGGYAGEPDVSGVEKERHAPGSPKVNSRQKPQQVRVHRSGKRLSGKT